MKVATQNENETLVQQIKNRFDAFSPMIKENFVVNMEDVLTDAQLIDEMESGKEKTKLTEKLLKVVKRLETHNKRFDKK